MRRALVLGSVVLAGLIAAAPAAAGGPPQISFRLHADGFEVGVTSQSDGKEIALSLTRGRQGATYLARKAHFEGLRVSADFARFGALEMTFDPDAKKGSCEYGEAEGTFTGELSFTGERGYAHFDIRRARGTFELARCDEFRPGKRLWAPALVSPRRAPAERATLFARTPPGSFPAESVAAIAGDTGRFEGGVFAYREEFVEGVYVERRTTAALTADEFRWDHQRGTAFLRPPRPFSGHATFRRRPGGRPSWTGSLSVPILGGEVLRLTGHRFRAKLLNSVPQDE